MLCRHPQAPRLLVYEDLFLLMPLAQAAVGVVQKGLRPVIPSSCPAGLAGVMRDCWQRDPRERPSFETLKARLLLAFMPPHRPPCRAAPVKRSAVMHAKVVSGRMHACLNRCAWRTCGARRGSRRSAALRSRGCCPSCARTWAAAAAVGEPLQAPAAAAAAAGRASPHEPVRACARTSKRSRVEREIGGC